MTSIKSITNAFQSNWFKLKATSHKNMSIAVLKPEFQQAFTQSVAEEKVQREKSFLDWKSQRTPSTLDKEQLQDLSKKYNAKEMSQKDYEAFIDDLGELGVLSDEDKEYVSYGLLRKLDLGAPCAYVLPYSASPAKDTLAGNGGNALEWAKHRSTFEACDLSTQTFYRDRTSILFGRIAEVLSKI